MALGGSCLCGAVRYELTAAPVWAHACHCSRCRKTSGSACAPNLFFPLAALRWVQGAAELRRFRPPDAERFTHVFCGRCGSTLPFENPDRGLAGVPMGTLDVDPGYALRAHIFVASKAPWETIADGLPQHPEGLGSGTDPAS
jgi:hypothetical protein